MGLLAKDPQARFPSALAAAEAMEALAPLLAAVPALPRMDAPPTSHASPVPAPPTVHGTTYTGPRPVEGYGYGPPPAPAPPRRSHNGPIAAVVVAVVAVLGLVVVLVTKGGGSSGDGATLANSPAPATTTDAFSAGPATAGVTSTPEPERTIDPVQAAVVRHQGQATLRSENYIDLDSRADNWDQNSTAGAASPDIQLSYSGTRIESYNSGISKSIVPVQPGSPATFETCNAATGYTSSIESADIQDRKAFCVATDGNRYSYVTIAAADPDPNGGFSRVVLNIKTFELRVRPTPTS
jgi:hypothetical protein